MNLFPAKGRQKEKVKNETTRILTTALHPFFHHTEKGLEKNAWLDLLSDLLADVIDGGDREATFLDIAFNPETRTLCIEHDGRMPDSRELTEFVSDGRQDAAGKSGRLMAFCAENICAR